MLAFLLMLLTFCLRAPFWARPLDMDEGLYAYGGWQLLQGSTLYKDLWDLKPPAIYFLNALVFWLSAPAAIYLYVCAALFSSLTCLAVYKVTGLLWGKGAAFCSSLFFALFACSPYWQGCGLNTEVFMIAPMAWSFYLVLKHAERGGRGAFFGAGLLLGAATLFKQVAAIGAVLVVVAGYHTARKEEGGLRRALVSLFCFVAGATLPWIAFGLYFLHLGAIKDFLFWLFVYPSHYMSAMFGVSSWGNTYLRSRWVVNGTLAVWLFSILGLVTVLRRSTNFRERLACLFYPLSIIGVCAGWNFFPHYFVQMAPVLAIFSGKGLAHLLEGIRQRGRRLLCGIGMMLLVLSGALFLQAHHRFFFSYSGDEMSMQEYLWGFPPTPRFGIARRLGLELREMTQEKETIFVWSHHPEVNFYALRKTPARTPLVALPGLNNLEDVIMGDVQGESPGYVVVFDSLFLYNFPRLAEFIAREYVRAFDIEGLEIPDQGIYRKRTHEGR